MTTFIYSLSDPRDDQVRYIGKSNNPGQRFAGHVNASPASSRGKWIAEIKAMGLLPVMTILEEATADNWSEKEQYWIKRMKAAGYNLLNIQTGDSYNQSLRRTQLPTPGVARFNCKRLRELREQNGYTQEEIARLIDMSTRRYLDLERQPDVNPTLNTMSRLAQVFNVKVTDLIVEA